MTDPCGHRRILGYGYAMRPEPKQALHAAIWAYTGLHLLVACLLPLAAHEAHYALYARHLALSYLDHPPLAPWLQSLVLWVSDTDAALRVLPLALSVCAQYLLALLTRRVYPDGSAWLPVFAVLLLQGTLVFHGGMTLSPDAPLLPHQLKRLSRRAGLGLARNGSVAHNGSGDIFIAFSTADRSLGRTDRVLTHRSLPNDLLDPLFTATVQATEEAIINALVAARDMTGDEGRYAKALPHDELIEVMKRYGRFVPPTEPERKPAQDGSL